MKMRTLLLNYFQILSLLLFVFSESTYARNLNIEKSSITISGLSSGGYMAEQLQIAYSSMFHGLAVVAAGPYYCSRGRLSNALHSCMDQDLGLPNTSELVAIAKSLEAKNKIDSLGNLSAIPVFIFSSQSDSIIHHSVAKTNISFLEQLGLDQQKIFFKEDINSGHAWLTNNYGNKCSTADEIPFINNCNYDLAGAILNHLYGKLEFPVLHKNENFMTLSQSRHSKESLDLISMARDAIIYIPSSCQHGEKCKLHVSLHGCRQTTDDIGDQFYKNSGLADWAESNNIVVLFPQTKHGLILNPKACWDWWGYTGEDFHTKNGKQIQIIYRLIQSLLKGT